jgi:hypothetical protein
VRGDLRLGALGRRVDAGSRHRREDHPGLVGSDLSERSRTGPPRPHHVRRGEPTSGRRGDRGRGARRLWWSPAGPRRPHTCPPRRPRRFRDLGSGSGHGLRRRPTSRAPQGHTCGREHDLGGPRRDSSASYRVASDGRSGHGSHRRRLPELPVDALRVRLQRLRPMVARSGRAADQRSPAPAVPLLPRPVRGSHHRWDEDLPQRVRPEFVGRVGRVWVDRNSRRLRARCRDTRAAGGPTRLRASPGARRAFAASRRPQRRRSARSRDGALEAHRRSRTRERACCGAGPPRGGGTSTRTLSVHHPPTGRAPTEETVGLPWGGSGDIDRRPGAELFIPFASGASYLFEVVLTWRGSRLSLLPSPPSLGGATWTSGGSLGTGTTLWGCTRSALVTFVMRPVERNPGYRLVGYRGAEQRWRWRAGRWALLSTRRFALLPMRSPTYHFHDCPR